MSNCHFKCLVLQGIKRTIHIDTHYTLSYIHPSASIYSAQIVKTSGMVSAILGRPAMHKVSAEWVPLLPGNTVYIIFSSAFLKNNE